MSEEQLVSISEASRILGVSEPALRQWTDEGRIKAFVTPGGHRRYSKTELRKLVTTQQKTIGIKDLVATLESTVKMHREVAERFRQASVWYSRLSEESHLQLASLGRRLLSLIIRYVAEPGKREETLALARDVGSEFGETLAKLGVPLTDSVQAFILNRDPVLNAVAELMRKKQPLNERIVAAMPLVDHLMDEALMSLVSAHQQHKAPKSQENEVLWDDIDNTSAL